MSWPLHSLFSTAARISQERLRAASSFSSLPWTCQACLTKQRRAAYASRRALHTSSMLRDIREQRRSIETVIDGQPATPATTSTSLPSHIAKQRSAFTTRLSQVTDSILARASVAGQHINTYTGTDYTGIDALRKEIVEQEVEVRTRHAAVADAKTRHTEARTKQASSQKEIVGLLERKSSWTPGDLERYMTLVRSEHVDDQAVQKASEDLALAERELEGTRTLLEKLERKQYHEEQIWSDTIRRNSTWVTIGLMGVNILLLLAQISIFEPYRRRKIVKQIEEALDERTVAKPVDQTTVIEQIDLAIEPRGITLEQIESNPLLLADDPQTESDTASLESPTPTVHLTTYLAHAQESITDLFSEKSITVRHVDMATLALGSAAVGTGLATVLSLLLFRMTG